MTTELESRTFWFGADTSQTFTALFAPELILNFGAVSLTLAIFRTISHLVSGALYHWFLPFTSGDLREFLDQMTFLKNPQTLAFSVWLNASLWLFGIIGRIVFDLFVFGPTRTYEGLYNKSIQDLVDFVFSEPVSFSFLGRVFFEGFGLVFGWAAIRAAGDLTASISRALGGRKRRSASSVGEFSADPAGDFAAQHARIVKRFEEERR